MSWTDAAQLRTQLQKLWDSGALLASVVPGAAEATPEFSASAGLFPRRLVLKGPTSGEMAERFQEVRAWAAALRALAHGRVTLRTVRHRLLGSNEVPSEVWVDTLDDAIAWLGRRPDLARFTALVRSTQARQPLLLPWLARRPLRALALAEDWPRLLDVVGWLQAHPRPGLYVRQIDIAGVHSKFIEAQRSVLADLLDLVLPPEAVDATASGAAQFEARYGLRAKPLRIRLRLLDPAVLPGAPGSDLTLDAADFACLQPQARRVFITENEINFLAFPPHPASVVIFGAGYGFEVLRRAQWLAHCQLHYWGDIDTHGFAILDQLRSQWPHVASLLMDSAPLHAHAALWGHEDQPTLRDLPRLTPEEAALYNDLRDNRLGKNLRLEQECIGFDWLQGALQRL